MNLDDWYNSVWKGWNGPKPTRGYHYQATQGSSELPVYHQDRQPLAGPMSYEPRMYEAPKGRKSRPQELKEMVSETRAHPGSASAGRYTPKEGPFCGPAGGAAEGTYPVKDFEHIRNALSRAHFAPNPEGVKKCACARAQALGLKGHFPSCQAKD